VFARDADPFAWFALLLFPFALFRRNIAPTIQPASPHCAIARVAAVTVVPPTERGGAGSLTAPPPTEHASPGSRPLGAPTCSRVPLIRT
jgi:hypothetical protein